MSDLDAHLAALRALNVVSKRVHASLDLAETLDAVACGVAEVGGFGVAVVNLAEANGDFTVVAVAGNDGVRRDLLGTTGVEGAWQELFRRGERWGSLYFVDHRRGIPEALFRWVPDIEIPEDPDGWHPMDCLFAPLMSPSGEWVGVLSVDLPVDGRRPGPLQREVMALFAEHAAIAILHARMHSALEQSQRKLRYAATHDWLTGLANRAFLRACVDDLRQQPGGQIGVLVIDLDGFKRVNDGAGHDAGDEVLQVLAERMQRHIREGDVLARIGGDEFILVLTGTDVAGPLHLTAERLRDVIALPITGRTGTHHVGASIGCAVGDVSTDFAELVSIADADMYRIKETRRGHARLHGFHPGHSQPSQPQPGQAAASPR